jgi:hypothetical protein
MIDREAYEREGFVVIPSGLPDEVLDAARLAAGPLQPAQYHYSDGPRIFEAWKTSDAVRAVAFAEPVLQAIRELHGTEPRALQTINFRKGSNQPMHQDGIHFQTSPLGRMVGAWCALEDMDERNGTLCYVPGSHRLGYLGWQALWFRRCKVGAQFEQYHAYEARIRTLAEIGARRGDFGKPTPLVCRKGDVFLWGLELLHGGWPIADPARTRFSQVTHYFLPPVDFGWAPMFSDPGKGVYLKKSMRWFDREGNLHDLSAATG